MVSMRSLSDMVEIQMLKEEREDFMEAIDGLLTEMQMIVELTDEIKSLTDDEEIFEIADFISAIAEGDLEEMIDDEEELDLDNPEEDLLIPDDLEEIDNDDPWMYRS